MPKQEVLLAQHSRKQQGQGCSPRISQGILRIFSGYWKVYTCFYAFIFTEKKKIKYECRGFVGLVFCFVLVLGGFFCLKTTLNGQSNLWKRSDGSEIWKLFSDTKYEHTSNYKSTMYNFFYLSVKYSSFSMATQEIASISNVLLN